MVTEAKSVANILTEKAIPFTWNLFTESGSIMKLLQDFIVEPTIFVSKDLRHKDNDILHKAIAKQIDTFCCFYSLAFQVLNGLAGTKEAVNLKALGTLNYDYHLDLGNVAKTGLSHPTVKEGIKKTKDHIYSIFTAESYNGHESGIMRFRDSKFLSSCFENNPPVSGSHLDMKKLEGVGYGIHTRFFEISTKRSFIKEDEEKDYTLVIPIVVRAHIVFIDEEDINTVLDVKHDKNGLIERWTQWRAGGITFKDLIFATDLVKEYRKTKKANHNTILDILNGKTYNATLTAFENQGKKGFEKFFNLYIISSEIATSIERSLRGKLIQSSFTQALLTKLQAMDLMVLDTEYDIGQIYYHELPGETTFKLSTLTPPKKDGGVNLSDTLKAIYSNRPPVF